MVELLIDYWHAAGRRYAEDTMYFPEPEVELIAKRDKDAAKTRIMNMCRMCKLDYTKIFGEKC